MDQSNLYYSPEQVQQILNISYSTLLRFVKRNEIPYKKFGRQLRFPCSYFEQVVDISDTDVEGELND